jgi:putative CocE/NonD family hydrolase
MRHKNIASILLLSWLVVPVCLAQDRDSKDVLADDATIERKAWVSMRDGVRLSTDIYRPKDAEGPLPTIFWRTPYNYNKLRGSRSRMAKQAIENGYAFVIQNERGKYFSEGEWEILGRPRTDGYDTLDWIAAQEWSNGKVGTIGCSSSAEWQMGLAAMDHPAHAAMVPMAAGAGIGRVGEFYEQGNWYRGGVFQMLFATWLYGVQNTQRPTLPADLSREDLERLSLYFDLAPKMPDVEWSEAIRHLPVIEIMENVDGPKGIYKDFIQRKPNDPAWYEGGLYHDNEDFGVPALWLNSWYDVSTGPNIALYQHVRGLPDKDVADNQFMIIAPTAHCGFFSKAEETIVGERNFGDARLEYNEIILDWFDFWLKDEDNGFTEETARVRYFTMGENVWQEADAWPPPGVTMTPFYLSSDKGANSLYGDGYLSIEKPATAGKSSLHYDPLIPVPSLGGGVCCTGGAVQPGSFDQRGIEVRNDVLVYTSDPFVAKTEISGPVEITLYVSSSAKDTDFTLKLIDVEPDGTAWNLDETIQRVRYREGYDKEVFMQPGEVYELKLGPLVTSATIDQAHRIRIEVSSSNFPRFVRNLNTGGNNYDESEGAVAINSVHHSTAHASRIVLPVVRRD